MENKAADATVMFVDDEPQILKAIRRVVQKEPYQSLFVQGGAHALEQLQHTQVQVIVSDLKMPEMDGLTLLKEVQVNYPHTIRLVLSAVTDVGAVLEAVHEGRIYRYLTKPYDERELRQVIHQALDYWRVRKEKRDLQAQLAEQNRLLEKRAKERTAQLLAIERQAELGRYAAQIVHNLKNPLQAVIGQISLAKLTLSMENRSIEAIEEHLDRMEAAADNLTRIVSGILRHAKNPGQFDIEWTQLDRVIENELQFFDANPFFKYEVDKQIHLDDDLPAVWANPLHLQQIVDNLVNNALDAMAESRLKILTIATHADANKVFLVVSDTGTGIHPKDLPFIFFPDFTTKPPDKGTGLGLASVKAMLESYGGHIEVQPNAPQGTRFIVILPLKKQDEPADS